MSGWQHCSKCGSVMNMKIGYGYIYFYECPNKCQQKSIEYTTSSTTILNQRKINYSNNSGV